MYTKNKPGGTPPGFCCCPPLVLSHVSQYGNFHQTGIVFHCHTPFSFVSRIPIRKLPSNWDTDSRKTPFKLKKVSQYENKQPSGIVYHCLHPFRLSGVSQYGSFHQTGIQIHRKHPFRLKKVSQSGLQIHIGIQKQTLSFWCEIY